MPTRSARRARQHYFEQDAALRSARFESLYVAMTRAKQALLVSGNGKLINGSCMNVSPTRRRQRDNPLITEPAHLSQQPRAIQRSRMRASPKPAHWLAHHSDE